MFFVHQEGMEALLPQVTLPAMLEVDAPRITRMSLS
jgi:hypothetical protein